MGPGACWPAVAAGCSCSGEGRAHRLRRSVPLGCADTAIRPPTPVQHYTEVGLLIRIWAAGSMIHSIAGIVRAVIEYGRVASEDAFHARPVACDA